MVGRMEGRREGRKEGTAVVTKTTLQLMSAGRDPTALLRTRIEPLARRRPR
jgi:hypothetical protein